MHIVVNINLLIIFMLVGGLIVLLWPKLFEVIKPLRYIVGIGFLVLGAMSLFGIHIMFIN